MSPSVSHGGTHTSNQHSTSIGSTTSYGFNPKSKVSPGSTEGNPEKASPSQSFYRTHLSELKSPSFQDLIQKGRQARADDERNIYETKKAKLEADRAKAARARLAVDNAVHNLALESRSDIDKSKGKLIEDMEKNLRALIEAEFRADIRERVYEDEQKIRALHEREIKDSTRMRLEADLEPVIVAELQAKHEEDIRHALKAELKAEVKEELRAECKIDFGDELRDELEGAVRKELEDLYREEVRSELKRELSSSVREELMDRLGLQQSFPALVDLENEESSDPDLSNSDGLRYHGDYQVYEGESQHDEEENGEDVFDDAPEEQGNGALDDFSSSTIDADHLANNLKDTEDLLNPVNGLDHIHNDPVDQDNHSFPSVGVDQSINGLGFVSSGHLKRHIDENYDEFDEEDTSDVDRPVEKKIKLSTQDDLTTETLPAATNTNGEYQNGHAQVSGAHSLEESEEEFLSRLNDQIKLDLGEQQFQEEGETKADAEIPHLTGKVNAYCDAEESCVKVAQEETEGHSPFTGAVDTSASAKQPYGADNQEEHGLYPNLNDFDSEYHTHEHPQSNEDPFAEKQYQTLEDKEVDETARQDPELTYDKFDHEEEHESDLEKSDGGDRLEDEGEEYDEGEECSVGQNGPTDLQTHKPFGNYYYDTQAQRDSRKYQNYPRLPSPEEDEEATDEEEYNEYGLDHEQVQAPFGQQYRVKRARDDDSDLEEEEIGGHYSKRYRAESYSGSEEEYDSEPVSTETEDESPGQDTLRQGNPYGGVIQQTNTQDDPYVIESSDEEGDPAAIDDEKTLVEEEHLVQEKNFPPGKGGIYEENDEDSLFVT